MIQRTVYYEMSCDKCGEYLRYKEPHSSTLHVGRMVKVVNPGTIDDIKKVAESCGWKISGDVHFCEKCSQANH
jgi:hypothetical protein